MTHKRLEFDTKPAYKDDQKNIFVSEYAACYLFLLDTAAFSNHCYYPEKVVSCENHAPYYGLS